MNSLKFKISAIFKLGPLFEDGQGHSLVQLEQHLHKITMWLRDEKIKCAILLICENWYFDSNFFNFPNFKSNPSKFPIDYFF